MSFKVTVTHAVQEAVGIRSFRLAGFDGRPLPSATPGSHVDVHTPGGPVRQYSLCEPGGAEGYTIAVKREEHSRGGSAAMHRVEEGDVLTIGAPRNAFPLVPDVRRHLLVAGGIGITPILAMARALASDGADFALHYFARSPEHAAFRDIVTGLGACTRLHVGLDPVATSEELSSLLARPVDGTHVYTCGPTPLMDAVGNIAAVQGWPASALHEERFTPAEGGGAGFRVVLARTGGEIEVAPTETALDALLGAGVDVDYSCEQGICGTCVTTVLDGEIDHRDHYLTDDEKAAGDRMCVCVSRCQGPVLRLDV